LTCCDVYGNQGGDWIGCIADQYGTAGNISADPLFCDPVAGDHGLVSPDSPCLPENNECGVLIGAHGLGCDILAAENTDDGLPRHTRLCRVHPNPFNPRTTITFELARAEWAAVVVYDLGGGRVEVLASDTLPAGSHAVTWRGCDSRGQAMPSGTYIVRLETESGVEVRKVSLIR
jgi:hypothetical protein